MRGMHSGATVIAILVLFTAPVQGSTIRGSFKPGVELTEFQGEAGLHFIADAPIRLMVSGDFDPFRFDIAYALSPRAGAAASQDPIGFTPYRLVDLIDPLVPDRPDPGTWFRVRQNLDRLSLRFRSNPLTLTAGRQAVHWGVGRALSPTDFIAPFRYGTLDAEYRVGVDAFRIRLSTGDLSELDGGWLFGEEAIPSRGGGWLRGRFYLLRTDISCLAGYFRENLIFGGSFNRAVGEANGWVEAALVAVDELAEDSMNRTTYWSLVAGWERSWLEATLTGSVECIYNSAGACDPEDYTENSAGPAYTVGDAYLQGKYYLAAATGFTVTPLLQIGSGFLLNLCDPSAYVHLEAEYGIAQDVLLSAGLRAGIGKGDDRAGSRKSEMAGWPSGMTAYVSWYF